jgi:hypothetical protein
MAKPIPYKRNLLRWCSGNLSAKMEIKIILSIPKITSKAIREISGINASIIYHKYAVKMMLKKRQLFISGKNDK